MCHNKFTQFSRYYNVLSKTASPVMLGMFLITGSNMCTSLILILFYAENLLQKLYFTVYGTAMPLQIYLACYYGTAFQEECDNLTKAIFACNWVEQTKEFTKDLRIFLENSLRKFQFTAGGVMVISLNGFLQVMKSTYSLFAVLNQMRE